MAILSGRDGQVLYDPAGITPVLVISISGFTIDLKTDKIEVTCFGDTNKVYVPSMRDVSGTVTGFYDSTELDLIAATAATTPGKLELVPHTTEATKKFTGLAYIDCAIDTTVADAPKLTGTWMAAGPWTLPV